MKHPGIAVIMGLHKGKPEDDGPDSEEEPQSHEEHMKAMEDAADEMFDAVKSGNKEGFRAALDAYCDLHGAKPEPSSDDLKGDDDEEDGY